VTTHRTPPPEPVDRQTAETTGAPASSARVTRRAVLGGVAALALAACSAPTTDPAGPSSAPASTGGDAATPDTSAASTAGSASSAPSASAPGSSSSPKPADGAPAVEVTHGPRTTAAVALTFHGAGDPALADRVLAAAEKAHAAVTVLAVGTWLQQHPAVAARILRGGHELGNHTWHHRPMRLMDEATAYAEIEEGRKLVAAHTSQPSWFRPSGTPHATPHILAAAGRAGYRTSLSFDVDPADYTDPGAAAVVSRVLAQVRAGSIVSLHLGHAGTATALPTILDGLASRGLAAVTVSALLPGVSP
jgi:peptidoglycan/xylan/chitin deacetylase (PgdA/CDA1 family)